MFHESTGAVVLQTEGEAGLCATLLETRTGLLCAERAVPSCVGAINHYQVGICSHD